MSGAMVELVEIMGKDEDQVRNRIQIKETYDSRVHLASNLIYAALKAGASPVTLNVGSYFKIAEEIDNAARARGWVAGS